MKRVAWPHSNTKWRTQGRRWSSAIRKTRVLYIQAANPCNNTNIISESFPHRWVHLPRTTTYGQLTNVEIDRLPFSDPRFFWTIFLPTVARPFHNSKKSHADNYCWPLVKHQPRDECCTKIRILCGFHTSLYCRER